MTSEQSIMITNLMKEGMGYRKIATELNLPINSVKSWCRRHPVVEIKIDNCLMCGKEIHSLPHKRKKKFCSDSCRYKWWSAHSDEKKNKTEYNHVCKNCGREFFNNRKNADYCGRECFALSRQKTV